MLKNPFINRIRAVFAILGIAIGIGTIVALVMITVGLQTATTSTLHAGAAEITVAPKGFNAILQLPELSSNLH
jgi:putative ABC transport system permease protein